MFRNFLAGSIIIHLIALAGVGFFLPQITMERRPPVVFTLVETTALPRESVAKPFAVKKSKAEKTKQLLAKTKQEAKLNMGRVKPQSFQPKSLKPIQPIHEIVPKLNPTANKPQESPKQVNEADKGNINMPAGEGGQAVVAEMPEFNETQFKADAKLGNSQTPSILNDNSETNDSGNNLKTNISAPHLIYAPSVKYPRLAYALNWEGKVGIEIVINAKGKVVKAIPISSSGYNVLDEAAVEAVKKRRYRPAMKDGHPIEKMLRIQYIWRLTDANY